MFFFYISSSAVKRDQTWKTAGCHISFKTTKFRFWSSSLSPGSFHLLSHSRASSKLLCLKKTFCHSRLIFQLLWKALNLTGHRYFRSFQFIFGHVNVDIFMITIMCKILQRSLVSFFSRTCSAIFAVQLFHSQISNTRLFFWNVSLKLSNEVHQQDQEGFEPTLASSSKLGTLEPTTFLGPELSNADLGSVDLYQSFPQLSSKTPT